MILDLLRRIVREGRVCPLRHKIPPHTLDEFNRKRDEEQKALPFPVVARDRRAMEERHGFKEAKKP